MCWGAYGPRSDPNRFSGLWQDDIDGIQSQHRKLFRDARPPSHAASVDLKSPLDVEKPWPLSGGGENLPPEGQRQVRVAIFNSRQSSDYARVYVSANHAIERAYSCVNINAEDCAPGHEDASQLEFVRNAGERIIYRLAEPIDIKDSMVVNFYLKPTASLPSSTPRVESVRFVRR